MGRDFDTIKKTWKCECVAIAPTREEAERVTAASPFCTDHAATLIGTPEEVVAQLEAWAALGTSHLQLRFADFPRTEGIRLFMDAVLPHFA